MNESQDEHFSETYRSLITIALEAFRYLALVNGGAAVALVTYLANTSIRPSAGLRCSMVGFVAGLISCGLGLLFAYFTQFMLLNEDADRVRKNIHTVPLCGAVILYVLSLAAFAFGAWSAVVAFT